MTVFTIGFTQKHAEDFYEKLISAKVDVLIDVRLNNTSQLASFSKYPDIQYFLKRICDIEYIHDKLFSPTESLLKSYKSGNTSWKEYEEIFFDTMNERDIDSYIKTNYSEYIDKNICLLCSEATPEFCHRRLVADYFKKIFDATIIHL